MKTIAPALAAILLVGTAPLAMTTPALAYPDDVEFICGEGENGAEDWCVSVEDLKADCPLADPDNTTEECQGLEEERPGNHGINTVLIEGATPVLDWIKKKQRTARHFEIMDQSAGNGDSEPAKGDAAPEKDDIDRSKPQKG